MRKFLKNLLTTDWEKQQQKTVEEFANKYEELLKQQEIEKRDREQEENRNHVLEGYEIVKAIDLKEGDFIIHKQQTFEIVSCGCGYGASSPEFGSYFYLKVMPVFVTGEIRFHEEFWSYQRCPMIRKIKNQ